MQLPAQPSRHRVAVWRELRAFGAVPMGQGTWTAPDVPTCATGAAWARDLARRGAGDLIVLRTTAEREESARLRALFDAARRDEGDEFVADCGKFIEEIAREIAKGKLTTAELDEEEHGLERLRRWFRTTRAKDVFEVYAATDAESALARCVQELARYNELVYAKVHG